LFNLITLERMMNRLRNLLRSLWTKTHAQSENEKVAEDTRRTTANNAATKETDKKKKEIKECMDWDEFYLGVSIMLR